MKTIVSTVLVLAGLTCAAPKYPFPYFADYPAAKAVHFSRTYSSLDVQLLYEGWKKSFYEECSNGNGARIKWADPKASGACNSSGNCTVSEGIGYGMLVAVYMDNPTNNTKGMFDKLWTYYNKFLDNKGLMNWKINGCSGTVEEGAATDAELDVGLALAMAYKQWGDDKYLSDLKTFLGKVWTHEVDGAKLLKPGSQFASPFNPSYASIGALRVFASLDPAHDWNAVADNSMGMLAKNAHSTTGLPSDWCNASSPYSPVDFKGSGNTKFGFDAARTPWRVALSYIWFGKDAEKQWLNKIGSWIRTKTGGSWPKTFADWSLDGNSSANYTNSLYLGAFASTGFASPADSAWFRKGAEAVLTKQADNYYNDSWQLMYALTFMGNFQNFAGTVMPVGVGARAVDASSWSVHRTSRGIELRGEGSIEAQLRDVRGRVLQTASGEGVATFQAPQARGVYYVNIPGARAIPVLVD